MALQASRLASTDERSHARHTEISTSGPTGKLRWLRLVAFLSLKRKFLHHAQIPRELAALPLISLRFIPAISE